MTMNQKTSDQEWQQLQLRIDNFFGQSLRNNPHTIEYNKQLITQIPVISFERHSEKLLASTTGLLTLLGLFLQKMIF
jgi:hypothetical protein